MKCLPLTLCLFLFSCFLYGQPSFIAKPVTRQLYARNINTNLAAVHFQGTVQGDGSKTYLLKRFKYINGTDLTGDGSLDLELPLPNSGNFSFDDFIPAGLVNYRYRVYEVLSPSNHNAVGSDIAREVVAGDAYIIYGQSNAEAGKITESANGYQDNFIRAVGNRVRSSTADFSTWSIADGDNGSDALPLGAIGQWGLYMAKQIINNHGIPLAILSFPEPGSQIWKLERDDVTPSNTITPYGRLLQKVINSGLKDNIKGIFYFQGESDASDGETKIKYKNFFKELYDDWKIDFPGFQKIYLFQIKSGCGVATPETALSIQQAQKELAEEKSDIDLISTNHIANWTDNCHYGFLNGYLEIGIRAYNYVKKDFYGGMMLPNEETPFPKQAVAGGVGKIQLHIFPASASYALDPDFKNMIKLNGSGMYSVNSLSLSDNILEISYTHTGADPVTISVYGNGGPASPSLYNAGSVGLMSFQDLLIDAALPLQLNYFKLKLKNNQRELSWEMLNNEVFTSFDIQISSDGKKWRTAATVPAQTTPIAQYLYLLNEAVSGTQYYRLSSSKKGGEIEYSYILKHTENQSNNRFSVYPNPLSDNSIIHFWSSFAEAAKITLCNFEGKSIASKKVNLVKGSNSFPLPMPGILKKGLYIAKVETGSGIYQLKVMF